MEFYIGKEFKHSEYDEAFAWLEEQENPYYTIEEIDPVGDERMFVLVDETPTPEEIEQRERERIAKLKLTKREVFLGLFQAKGVIPDQIKAQITDPAALIEFEYANDYYRGNPLIDIVGAALGITPAQLDKFFETNDYTYLISGADVNNSEELAEENPVVEDITPDENVNNFSEGVNNTEVG